MSSTISTNTYLRKQNYKHHHCHYMLWTCYMDRDLHPLFTIPIHPTNYVTSDRSIENLTKILNKFLLYKTHTNPKNINQFLTSWKSAYRISDIQATEKKHMFFFGQKNTNHPRFWSNKTCLEDHPNPPFISHLGLVTMVINHLLNGMILQVVVSFVLKAPRGSFTDRRYAPDFWRQRGALRHGVADETGIHRTKNGWLLENMQIYDIYIYMCVFDYVCLAEL